MISNEQHQEKDKEKPGMMGTFLVIISAASYALMAIFAKYAYQADVNTLTMLSLRFSIAAIVMWAVILVKKENPRVERRELFALLGLGAVVYGLMSIFFFNCVRLIPASIASILLYTYPVIVTILSSFMFRERITKYKIMSLLISSAGLLMVVGVAFHGLNFLGVFYGFMSAVMYSLYIVISNKYVMKVKPVVVTTYVITSAAVTFNIIGWYKGSISLSISPAGWLAILAIALISSVAAMLTFLQGMKIVGPSRASIISTLEPVITILAAFILFREKMSFWQVLGAAMVIGAVLLIQRDQ